MYCFECGFKLVEKSKFCSKCGTKQQSNNSEIIREEDLVTKDDLKYHNGKLFTGESFGEWDFLEESDEISGEEYEEGYFKTVNRKRKANYLKGKLHGLWEVMTENENGIFVVTDKKEYENGLLIKNTEYNIDGTFKLNATYENGSTKLIESYLAGNLWLRTEYAGNKIHKEEYYHKIGQLSVRKTVILNNLGREVNIGTLKSYNEDGTPLDDLSFDDKGNANGIWKRYNEKGELFLEQLFKNGTLIKENYQEDKKRAWFRMT